ncbi:MAG: hypothetical protein AAB906_00450, partial [Patescibacteria group bacterium]
MAAASSGDPGTRAEGPRPSEPGRLNHRISAEDDLGAGGPVEKYKGNVEALKLLKLLESEGRFATAAEQKVLARFVGWGGLPHAFDPQNAAWDARYKELQALLSDEEYEAARRSTLNAHYTSLEVVGAIWMTLQKLGFKGGRILEPSLGVGNLFGALPQEISAATRLTGVELDSLTGR